MKNTISIAISLIFITFCIAVFTGFMNLSFYQQKTDAYHYATVNEIESSDFSPVVIADRMNNEEFKTFITEKSVKDDLRIYEVRTEKEINIPIIGISKTYVKESIAR